MIIVLYCIGAFTLFVTLLFLEHHQDDEVLLCVDTNPLNNKEVIFFMLALIWPLIILSTVGIWILDRD